MFVLGAGDTKGSATDIGVRIGVGKEVCEGGEGIGGSLVVGGTEAPLGGIGVGDDTAPPVTLRGVADEVPAAPGVADDEGSVEVFSGIPVSTGVAGVIACGDTDVPDESLELPVEESDAPDPSADCAETCTANKAVTSIVTINPKKRGILVF